MPIICKKLIGYSNKELKEINVQSNTHSGEWDYDKLDDWENDLMEFALKDKLFLDENNFDINNLVIKKKNIETLNLIFGDYKRAIEIKIYNKFLEKKIDLLDLIRNA